MDSVITLIKDNWLELVNRQKDLPKPFEQEVFLLNCHIAGTSHAEAAKERANDIQPGLPLTLRREPANEHDEQAIAVLLPSGERIGYIPQKHNPVISRLMDAGKLIFAKVTEAELKGNWLHARIDIFLKD
jgi:hypothetical protein